MGAIYRIWNIVKGKSYIGQSYQPYERIRQHFHSQGNSGITVDLLNYPPHSWRWEILANNDDDERIYDTVQKVFFSTNAQLNALERKYIHQYDSIRNGYNVQPGGGVHDFAKTVEESLLRSTLRQTINQRINAYQSQQLLRMSMREWLHWQGKTEKICDTIKAYDRWQEYRTWREGCIRRRQQDLRRQEEIQRQQEERRRQQEIQRQQEEQRRQREEEQRRRDALYLERYGTTRDQYERIISDHGTWEAYQLHMQKKHEDGQFRSCMWAIGVIIFIIVCISQC